MTDTERCEVTQHSPEFDGGDAENVAVRCTATLATTVDDVDTTVQCEDHLYGHAWTSQGLTEHHWSGPGSMTGSGEDASGYPDVRFWTDDNPAATAAGQ